MRDLRRWPIGVFAGPIAVAFALPAKARVVAAACVVFIALLAMPFAARADDTVLTVKGSADTGAADPRVAALDAAFATATREVLAELVDRAERDRRRADLDREIIARARLWVTSFKVIRDQVSGTKRNLDVAVTIRRGKLIARLGELSIAVAAADSKPVAGTSQLALILLRLTTPGGSRVATEGDADGARISKVLQAGGIASVLPKTASSLDPDSAQASAAAAGADWVLIVDARGTAPESTRGAHLRSSWGSATLRLLDRSGRAVIETKGVGGAYETSARESPDDPIVLATRAAIGAALQALPAIDAAIHPSTAAPRASAGEVLVHVSFAPGGWNWLATIRDELVARKAVVSIRRLDRTGVTLAVEGMSAANAVARALRGLDGRTPGSSIRVREEGARVEVIINSAPPGAATS